MGIGVSIFLIAVGAVLTFAVHTAVSGVNISTIGIILMIAGAIGLVTFLVAFGPRRGVASGGDVVEERVVHERY